jgi:hypothetical protein
MRASAASGTVAKVGSIAGALSFASSLAEAAPRLRVSREDGSAKCRDDDKKVFGKTGHRGLLAATLRTPINAQAHSYGHIQVLRTMIGALLQPVRYHLLAKVQPPHQLILAELRR